MSAPLSPRPDRREAIKWMLAASAAMRFSVVPSLGQTPPATTPPLSPLGYGRDPDLQKAYKPGEFWNLTFTDAQRGLAAALCDEIIPADSVSPSASDLHVHDFIDEWISAPYPDQQTDRTLILNGLEWLETESKRRFGLSFIGLIYQQRRMILDDICHEAKAAEPFKAAAKFFARFRDLTGGGFYTTNEGMKDLQYVGNVPLESFAGPPLELIRKLGLEDAVIP